MEYTEKLISDPEVKTELKQLTGKVLVPTIFVGHKYWIGFDWNKGEIEKAVKVRKGNPLAALRGLFPVKKKK